MNSHEGYIFYGFCRYRENEFPPNLRFYGFCRYREKEFPPSCIFTNFVVIGKRNSQKGWIFTDFIVTGKMGSHGSCILLEEVFLSFPGRVNSHGSYVLWEETFWSLSFESVEPIGGHSWRWGSKWQSSLAVVFLKEADLKRNIFVVIRKCEFPRKLHFIMRSIFVVIERYERRGPTSPGSRCPAVHRLTV